MLQILPFLAWVATMTSAVLLIVLWRFGDLPRRTFVILLGWFLLAVYCQFFAGSVRGGTTGLLLQTMLAVFLLVRFRLSG